MGLLETKYVLFKENGATHREEYVADVEFVSAAGKAVVETTEEVSEALGFDTPDNAYRYAGMFEPVLDWWRVGLRGSMT